MYVYEEQKPFVFTEKGQDKLLKIRDHAFSLLELSGAARLQEITASVGGDTWQTLACVDRLVERGDLQEIPTKGAAQHRVFVKG